MISPINLTEDQKKYLKLLDIAGSPNSTMQEVIDADIAAIKIYLGMGNSAEDAYKAFEAAFKNPDYANERLNAIKKFTEYNKGTDGN